MPKPYVVPLYSIDDDVVLHCTGSGKQIVFTMKLYWEIKRAFALYFLLQTIRILALLMIVMCIALVIRNNVVSIVIGICLCMNALIIFYSFIDRMLAKCRTGKVLHMINFIL